MLEASTGCEEDKVYSSGVGLSNWGEIGRVTGTEHDSGQNKVILRDSHSKVVTGGQRTVCNKVRVLRWL